MSDFELPESFDNEPESQPTTEYGGGLDDFLQMEEDAPMVSFLSTLVFLHSTSPTQRIVFNSHTVFLCFLDETGDRVVDFWRKLLIALCCARDPRPPSSLHLSVFR